jgi:hypothetical protein
MSTLAHDVITRTNAYIYAFYRYFHFAHIAAYSDHVLVLPALVGNYHTSASQMFEDIWPATDDHAAGRWLLEVTTAARLRELKRCPVVHFYGALSGRDQTIAAMMGVTLEVVQNETLTLSKLK